MRECFRHTLLLLFVAIVLSAQVPAQLQAPPPVTFTDEQDQQNMMHQLGIRALRPGPSGDEKAPNHANYDESQANPFPNVPDALTLNNGEKVTIPELWQKRRAEIIEGFECCVYGRIPKGMPKVSWSVTRVDHERVGFTPVIAKEVSKSKTRRGVEPTSRSDAKGAMPIGQPPPPQKASLVASGVTTPT